MVRIVAAMLAVDAVFLFVVPPEAFDPPPKVESAVIELQFKPWAAAFENDSLMRAEAAPLYPRKRAPVRRPR